MLVFIEWGNAVSVGDGIRCIGLSYILNYKTDKVLDNWFLKLGCSSGEGCSVLAYRLTKTLEQSFQAFLKHFTLGIVNMAFPQ